MENMKPVLVIGGAALVGWYLWTQGYLYQWFGILPPGTTPSTPGSTPAVAASTAGGTQPPPAATPAPAPPSTPAPPAPTVQIVGSVSPNINNSLSANVSINGQTINLSIVPSGQAYDSNGNNVTSTLQGEGVNVGTLLQQMQAAYAAQGGGSSSSSSASAGVATLITQLQAVEAQLVAARAGFPGPGIGPLSLQKSQLISAIQAAGGQVPAGMSGLGLFIPADAAPIAKAGRVPLMLVHGGPRMQFRRAG